MAVEKIPLLFMAIERDLYAFLRHSSAAVFRDVSRLLRLSPGQMAVLETMRDRAGALPKPAFDDWRAAQPSVAPDHDPFHLWHSVRESRTAEAQERALDSFARLVAQKRVVLVGPAISICGSRRGDAIEAYDLVVRMNFQWPIDPTMAGDLGSRMDVLYHCCNGDFPVSDLMIPAFSETRFVCWQANAESVWLQAGCIERSIPSLDITALYAELQQRLGTAPNTGTVAIEHLLRFDIAELYLTGISFLTEPSYPEYKGRGSSNGPHRSAPQLRYFREVIAADKRVRLDPTLERLR